MNTRLIGAFALVLVPLLGQSPGYQTAIQETVVAGDGGLICKIEVPDELKIVQNRIALNLVITNISFHPVQISTLCGGGSHVWKGNYQSSLRPGFWHSDRPQPHQIIEKIVTVEPNESIRMPLSIPLEAVWLDDDDGTLTVHASYGVGNEYADLYRVWRGFIQAPPVKIRYTPKKSDNAS